jgi:drug/metabolite transporter (DMT)-like permease
MPINSAAYARIGPRQLALFLDESLSPMQAAGALLVFGGLAVSVYGPQLLAWFCTQS